MSDEQPKPDAETIVELAFDVFRRLVERDNKLDSVLLEGLEEIDEGWLVSIGFNGKRQETSEPASVGSFAALAGYGSKTTTIVREVRHIFLDDEGHFKKIT